MKKVFLVAAVALMASSAFVSCGGSDATKNSLDSLINLANDTTKLNEMVNQMLDTTATTTPTDTTVK